MKRASLIIPVYNEENECASFFPKLQSLYHNGLFEIILVCNGCSDHSFKILSEFKKRLDRNIKVENISSASKTAAINLGIEHTNFFPKIIMDFDITISPEDLIRLIDKAESDKILAFSCSYQINSLQSDPFVRAYSEVQTYINGNNLRGLGGAGIYGFLENGATKIKSFPAIQSDDTYFRLMYQDDEWRTYTDITTEVIATRTVLSLIKVETRKIRALNNLKQLFPNLADKLPRRNKTKFLNIMYKPTLYPAFCIFIIIKMTCRLYASLTNTDQTWHKAN